MYCGRVITGKVVVGAGVVAIAYGDEVRGPLVKSLPGTLVTKEEIIRWASNGVCRTVTELRSKFALSVVEGGVDGCHFWPISVCPLRGAVLYSPYKVRDADVKMVWEGNQRTVGPLVVCKITKGWN